MSLTTTQRFELAQLCVDYEAVVVSAWQDPHAALFPLVQFCSRERISPGQFGMRDARALAPAVIAAALVTIAQEAHR